MSTFIASGTSYSTQLSPTIPFYIYYSMFGFQQVADLIWSAADSRARGFLIGATAGRTTLNGEGLQHQDGHSHLMAMTNLQFVHGILHMLTNWRPSSSMELKKCAVKRKTSSITSPYTMKIIQCHPNPGELTKVFFEGSYQIESNKRCKGLIVGFVQSCSKFIEQLNYLRTGM